MRIARSALVLVVALLSFGVTARGYLHDEQMLFLCGLLASALALGPFAFALGLDRAPRPVLGLCLAGSSFSIFLLVAELALRAAVALYPPSPLPVVFTYDEAIADPAGFLRWWTTQVRPGVMRLHPFTMPDPRGKNPYVLRPGTHQGLGGASFHINQLGFRGPEFSRGKEDLFRIVALGESTTFDVTLLPEDRPWTEVLEARIAEELACDRPVQVINAGVPGWTLANQVTRLSYEILTLSPDLVVSYHGFNGFQFLLGGISDVTLLSSTTPPLRGSRILERLEAGLRAAWFRRRYHAMDAIDASVPDADLLRTSYADWYRRLVEQARAGGAQVALCTFNLAVDADSPEEAIRLHEALVPDVRARILANQLHSRLVLELARSLGVLGIDTSRDLDGAYRDAYIDIAHFTQIGRERMAANVVDGLRATLRDHPQLHCHERAAAAAGQSRSSREASP